MKTYSSRIDFKVFVYLLVFAPNTFPNNIDKNDMKTSLDSDNDFKVDLIV